ncbi:STAS/SEC14 domain-containing protein [Maridesulfovibrio sp.]|uniref:STAS/SEC14 domain-containing protein n=1 Tax=Maridesulfovibrio sp. TaxID=2795000 RepID=UPI0029F507A6|nr:STAS/SEC14 domain-containing protein [Maridesulfovibrio sp.]
MITIMKESSGAMLAVTASETVTGEDYTEIWIPALQKVISEHGKCKALLYMDENFKDWDLKAMWEDAKFGMAHRNDFEKLAVVGGPSWSEWGTRVAGILSSGEVKTYSADKLQEALKWVAE